MMKIIDEKWLKKKTVAVIGLSKNSGKTTTLNTLIKEANRSFEKIGITSIGRDGEKCDVVGGHKKPQIFVSPKTVIATASELVSYCDASKRIIGSTEFQTPMGEVYLLEALSGGYVQIGGPSSVEKMIAIKKKMLSLGCGCVFIDGAVGRRSLGFSALADGVVLCTSANVSSNLSDVVDETSFIASLFDLPVVNGEDIRIVKGAVTDRVIESILSSDKKEVLKKSVLAFEDPSKILCSRREFLKISNSVEQIGLIDKPKLLAVTINPTSVYGWGFDGFEFENRLKGKISVPVFDVLRECKNA